VLAFFDSCKRQRPTHVGGFLRVSGVERVTISVKPDQQELTKPSTEQLDGNIGSPLLATFKGAGT
jgi:hypothetical protein